MTRLLMVTAAALCVGASAFAQDPASAPGVLENSDQIPSLANVTPEMWLYLQQLQRHDDPQQAVRRKAEQRAAAREGRLIARRWFGLSNARPTANPIPIMSTYSPFWAGNDSDPQRWNGAGPSVIRIDRETTTLR